MTFRNLSISVLKVGRQFAGLFAVAAFFILNLCSCFPDEAPVPLPEAGKFTQQSLNLSADYRNHAFYNLEQKTVVAQTDKTDWELAFDCRSDNFNVYLNQTKSMLAVKTQQTNIIEPLDTTGLTARCGTDVTNVTDSLVIGDVRKNNTVFLVDMGLDEKNDPIGFKKIKITVKDNRYFLEIADLDGRQVHRIDVNKDSTFNRRYFSLKAKSLVTIEPPRDKWDLEFTQYINQFYEPRQPYLVVGVLLNPHQTLAQVDSLTDFDSINLEFALKQQMSSKVDVIGFNWKSFINNTFIVNTKKCYIIRVQSGYYYKMHFVGFYDEKGLKGNPKFEFQRL
jgi:hypothetical protein